MDLCSACERGDYERAIKCLQISSSDVNKLVAKYRVHRTALHFAAEYGHLEIVKELLSYDADANLKSNDGRLPLHDACIGGFADVVQYLIPFTENINCVDNQGQTCAHVASFHGETKCLKVLLHNDIDVELTDAIGRSCLDLAVVSDHSATMNLLLQKRPSLVSKTNKEGRTAIHLAAQYGALNCLKCFHKNNSSIQCCDANGMMPVHLTAKHGMLSCLQFLIQAGCALSDSDEHDRTACHFAAASGSVDCLHWVMENDVDVRKTDESGNTVAHYAAMYSKSAEIINCLHQHGVNFDVANKNNDTPFDCARRAAFPVAFQKALSGEVTCSACVKKRKNILYEEAHKLSSIEQKITLQQSSLFGRNSFSKPAQSQSKESKKQFMPTERNLAAKYYGEDLFVMPSELDLNRK